MIGCSYDVIISALYKSGWRVLESEEGFSQLFKYERDITRVMEINYSGMIITEIRTYTYKA